MFRLLISTNPQSLVVQQYLLFIELLLFAASAAKVVLESLGRHWLDQQTC